MIRHSFLLLMALGVCLVGPAYAAPPDVKTPTPMIYLADNLDEKDGLEWCIDTVGRGLSDRLHAHSCKPRGGGSVSMGQREIPNPFGCL